LAKRAPPMRTSSPPIACGLGTDVLKATGRSHDASNRVHHSEPTGSLPGAFQIVWRIHTARGSLGCAAFR
jgi:hypothetical protein